MHICMDTHVRLYATRCPSRTSKQSRPISNWKWSSYSYVLPLISSNNKLAFNDPRNKRSCMAIIWVLVDFDFVIHRIIGLCQKESPQSFVRSSRKNSGCATKTLSILDSLAIPNLSLVGYCNSTRYPRVEKGLRMLDFIDFRELRSKRGRNTLLVLQFYYFFNVTVNQMTRLEICV